MGIEHAIHQDREARRAYRRDRDEGDGSPSCDESPQGPDKPLLSLFKQIEYMENAINRLGRAIDSHEKALAPLVTSRPEPCDDTEGRPCQEPPNQIVGMLAGLVERVIEMDSRLCGLTDSLQ